MPSDAIWTGIITGAIGLAGIAATALTAWWQGRFTHKQAERRERRQAYVGWMVAFNRVDSMARRPPPDPADLRSALHEYNTAMAAVELYGTSSVRKALADVQELLGPKLGEGRPEADGEAALVYIFASSFRNLREELLEAEAKVVAAMREDVAP
jgi:hypothetical protein